jgi:hypothetical protein
VWLGVCLCALLTFLPACNRDEPAPSLTIAIERTARYFDDRSLRGDQAFLLSQASAVLSLEFRDWVNALPPLSHLPQAAALDLLSGTNDQALEGVLWRDRNLAHRPWPSLPLPDIGPQGRTELSDEDLLNLIETMRLGLACDRLDATQRQRWRGLIAAPGHSYVLTHQLLMLVWARDRACLNDAEADALRLGLATAVYGELLSDRGAVNDLSLERMAMLCYAGLCSWVSDDLVTAVLRTQKADGSWGDASVPVHPNVFTPPAHTAALGFYVLALKWSEQPSSEQPRPPQ